MLTCGDDAHSERATPETASNGGTLGRIFTTAGGDYSPPAAVTPAERVLQAGPRPVRSATPLFGWTSALGLVHHVRPYRPGHASLRLRAAVCQGPPVRAVIMMVPSPGVFL